MSPGRTPPARDGAQARAPRCARTTSSTIRLYSWARTGQVHPVMSSGGAGGSGAASASARVPMRDSAVRYAGTKIKSQEGKVVPRKTRPPARFTEAALVKEIGLGKMGY